MASLTMASHAAVKSILIYFIGALGLVLLLSASWNTSYRFSNFELRKSSGASSDVSFPYASQSPTRRGTYKLEGTMSLGRFSPRSYRIVPDDRLLQLEVNEQVVDLSDITPAQLSDYRQGFTVDLSPYLHTGTNSIGFQFFNRGGVTGIGMEALPTDWRVISLVVLWMLLVGALLVHAMTSARIRWPEQLCYLVIIAGALVQIGCILDSNPVSNIWSDPQRHWEQGIDPLRIDLMAATDPILYQLFIGILAKLTLKQGPLVAFYISMLALVTPWVWYRFFRELQPSRRVALVGWAFLAFLPSWTTIYSYFMQETLLLPLLGAALWATWRCRRKGTAASFVLMILLWILAGLTRGISIPLAAVCSTWLWFEQEDKVRKAILSSAVLLLILGPLTYRSYYTVHQFAPHGMGHLASIYGMSGKREIRLRSEREGARWVHIFGSPSTGAKPFAPLSDWSTRRTGIIDVQVDLDEGSEGWNDAYEQINMDWEDFLWITKENLIFLFFAPSWPDSDMARALGVANYLMRWLWAPAFLLVLVWTLVSRRRMRDHWLLPVVILAWFIVQGLLPISVNEGRYRKPFEGLLIAQIVLLAGLSLGQDKPGPMRSRRPRINFRLWSRQLENRSSARERTSFPALTNSTSPNE